MKEILKKNKQVVIFKSVKFMEVKEMLRNHSEGKETKGTLQLNVMLDHKLDPFCNMGLLLK